MGKSQSPGSPTAAERLARLPMTTAPRSAAPSATYAPAGPGDAGEDEERDEEDPDHGSARGDAERRC